MFIMNSLIKFFETDFFADAQISVLRVIISLFISLTIGIIMGYFIDILCRKKLNYDNLRSMTNGLNIHFFYSFSLSFMGGFISGICRFVRQISPFAWLPLIIMLYGIGEKAVFITLLISMTFSAVLICRGVYARIQKSILEEAYCSGSSGFSHYLHVVLPLSLPGFLGCFRSLWAIGWQTVIAAEMLGVSSGLGFRLLDFRFLYKYKEMLIYILFIGILGWIVDHVIEYYEHLLYHKYF